MRLSQDAKTPVRPRDFWIAVVTTTVVLGGIGVYSMQNGHGTFGHVPQVPWLNGGVLLFIWVLTLYGLIKRGWCVFTWQWTAFLVGYTLFVSDKLWPHPLSMLTWVSNIGLLLMCIGILSRYIDFGKKPITTA
jgi:hypothetical protein